MLERVERVVADRALVERGQVPDVQVRGPERQRHERMGEDAQAPDDRSASTGRSIGPVSPSDERERGEVAEDDVLEHVGREEALLAEPLERRRHGQEVQDRARARS